MNDEKKPGAEEKDENTQSAVPEGGESADGTKSGKLKAELKDAKKALGEKEKELKRLSEESEKAKKELAAANEKYVRMLAEYDNFRRRTADEKDAIFASATSDVLTKMLPIADNLERAVQFSDGQQILDGLKMTISQLKAALEALGVKEIECETFDPKLHNAVIHIEDESYGEGQIVEVLQKGYIKGNRVIRYAMVKTAN